MKHQKATISVRFSLSENDVARLDEQCRRFEMPRSELLRYYIRQGYDSMADSIVVDQVTQQQLFPVTMPGGAHTTSPPLPKAPPKVEL